MNRERTGKGHGFLPPGTEKVGESGNPKGGTREVKSPGHEKDGVRKGYPGGLPRVQGSDAGSALTGGVKDGEEGRRSGEVGKWDVGRRSS